MKQLSSSLRVLLIDDQESVFTKLVSLIPEKNIVWQFCQDTTKAIEKIEAFQPTVILQELRMPEMNGFMLLHYLKKKESIKDIPIIVLSSDNKATVKAEAFSMGADDYIVKFPDKEELFARITYHSNSYLKMIEQKAAVQALETSQKSFQQELSCAARYLASFFPKPMTSKGISIDYRYFPNSQIGGDAFGSGWIDETHCMFFLLDVSGHGIQAALFAMAVLHRIQILLAKMETAFYSPKKLLDMLNKEFCLSMHEAMFFSFWYGIYNTVEKKLTYGSGGHPPAVVIGKDTLCLLQTEAKALGIEKNAIFTEASYSITDSSVVYLFSDGIFEIEQKDGTMFGFDPYLQLLKQPRFDKLPELDRIIDYMRYQAKEGVFEDDVTIIRVEFNSI